MSPPDHLRVSDRVRIPRAELRFRASRSGGPGGQHANKASTRVELEWDVRGSPSLSDEERRRIRENLGGRIDRRGVLHLADSSTRSQHRNREAVIARFRKLLRKALREPKKRTPTRPTKASKERRLRDKKHNARKKSLRGPVRRDE